jgi:anti-sigma B factor antagonist
METNTHSENDVTIVSVSGSIDALTYEHLQLALTDPIHVGVKSLVADLSGVDYTSSAGLRAILSAQKEIRQQGGDLRLAGVQPNVLKVLKLSGFTSIFKIYDDVEAAVASFGAEA